MTPASTVGSALDLAVLAYLAVTSVALAWIDLRASTLPNRIVLPAYGVVGALLVARAAVAGDPGALVRGLVGSCCLGSGYLVLAVVPPHGMGVGDAKLAGVVGLVLAPVGWGPLVIGAGSAFVLGGGYGAVALLAGRSRGTSTMPFGPWMLLGMWVGMFSGGLS